MSKAIIDEPWIEDVREFCHEFNIPIEHIKEILGDPKVVPMIRGKAFEFSVLKRLRNILSAEVWEVDKPIMNAQFGIHDMDIKVTHIATQKIIRIECKLAAKGSFTPHKPRGRKVKKGEVAISVKCMRSRTLGEEMVKALAPVLKVTEESLTTHNDQYRLGNFDVVITSIANAFYETDKETKFYQWQPTEEGEKFLNYFTQGRDVKLKDLAFDKMYLAKASDLTICEANQIQCSRKKCTNKTGCEFIPNYPVIKFKLPEAEASGADDFIPQPEAKWVEIENCEAVFLELIGSEEAGVHAEVLENSIRICSPEETETATLVES